MGIVNKEQSGVITVYLTLILTIILSLILISIESARVNVSELFSERVTSAAMKSVLAEFYRPLYDEYHIFALDAGYGEKNLNENMIKDKTIQYIEYNLDAKNNKFIISNPLLKSVNITGYNTLTSNNGKYFKEAVIDFQKYSLVTGLVEGLLDMLNLIEETKTAQSVLLKQVETEEKLVVIDERMQELIEIVDGVQFKDNMIKKTRFLKKIITASKFSKLILTKPVSSQNAGMNHPEIYKMLSNKYVNIMDKIEIMITKVKGISKKYNEYNSLTESKLRLENEIAYLRYQINNRENNINEAAKEELVIEQDKNLQNQIAKCKAELSRITAQCNLVDRECKKAKQSFEEAAKATMSINTIVGIKCTEALNVISSIKELQKAVKADVWDYKDTVILAKEDISEDMYQEFQKTAIRMEGYISPDSSSLSINLSEAERILKTQKDIIQKVEQLYYNNFPKTLIEENSLLNILYYIKELYKGYPSGLPFIDYTGLNTKNDDENKFFETANTLLKQGISGLIVDEKDLSKAFIKKVGLPSELRGITKDASISFSNILDLFRDSSISTLLSMNTLSDALTAVKSGAEELLRKVLLLSYVNDNFTEYLAKDYKSVLMYEKEYIINGKPSDIENINSIISKILMIRLAMNFLYLITDSTCKGKAETAAIAMVGFTGFPILVSIVKYIILAAWAGEGALVETTAIMKGLKVPLIVTRDNISVAFEEIVTMTKAKIKEKAEKIKGGRLMAGYKEYLCMFLLMTSDEKLCYRSMDLIQENIRSLYDDNFYMANCIVAYKTDTKYMLSEKFSSILKGGHYLFMHSKEMKY